MNRRQWMSLSGAVAALRPWIARGQAPQVSGEQLDDVERRQLGGLEPLARDRLLDELLEVFDRRFTAQNVAHAR